MVHSTYRARRPLKIGETTRQPGELVPEAQTWFRVDHLVHSGHLTRDVVEDEEFDQAVMEFCPDLIEALYPKEKDVDDNAAKKALERQAERVSDPGKLAEQLAAPQTIEDTPVEEAAAQPVPEETVATDDGMAPADTGADTAEPDAAATDEQPAATE